MKIMERTFNAATGETIEQERDMNSIELSEYKINLANAEAEEKAKSAKAIEKVALLAKLGITADEAALLLS